MKTVLLFLQVLLASLLGIFLGFVTLVVVTRSTPYVVMSGSMEPKLKVGSVVIVHSASQYSVGDIVSFTPPGKTKDTVTHRIVKAEDGVYSTKGDANEEADLWQISNKNIVGKTEFVIPYLGYLVEFAKKPQGFIFFIIIPATIIVYEELRSIKKELAKLLKERKKNDYYLPPHTSLLAYSLIPLFGIIFIFGFSATRSFFQDQEQNVGNILSAASVFPTPSPSPSPTLTPLIIDQIEQIQTP
jgi:signal peptidase I